MTRKAFVALVVAATLVLTACTGTPDAATRTPSSAAPASSSRAASAAPSASFAPPNAQDAADAEQVRQLIGTAMTDEHLRAVLIQVTRDGREVMTEAVGESMTGVPATTDMHFRNGAVAISMVATVLLQLVDEGTVSLDDTVSRWLPDLPHAGEVTLRQLAQMTAGYPDYVQQQSFMDAFLADPFRAWTPQELIDLVAALPLLFPPGTNWGYAHTNYVILGLALEEITGTPMDELISSRVLEPLGLTNTVDPGSPEIQAPALHAFTSERRHVLGVPGDVPFYEESTFWNPSWTITRGAIQTMDIGDMTATAIAVGEGTLLSPESHALMVSTALRGFGSPVEGCGPCFEQSEGYAYGIGIVTTGDWLLQNPMFAGYAGAMGYLAADRTTISLAVTYAPEAFDAEGDYTNAADALFRRIGGILSPEHPPPIQG